MLRLPEGQKVSSIHADWLRLGIGVVVVGKGLPEVPDSEPPPNLYERTEDYVDLELRPKVDALIQRFDTSEADAGLAKFGDMLLGVLAGTFDPRIELPERLLPPVGTDA